MFPDAAKCIVFQLPDNTFMSCEFVVSDIALFQNQEIPHLHPVFTDIGETPLDGWQNI